MGIGQVTALARRPHSPRHGGPAAVLSGLGSYVPPHVVDNDEIAERLRTSNEWIRSRTGIQQRRVIDPGMSTSDLAVEAGQRALKSANVESVDFVILATTTPDRPCPATAPEVASRIGLGGAAAFDLNAVCSGFLYALTTGAGLVESGVANRVLVIGADTFSTIINPACPTSAPIFGDGAGAVVLRAGEQHELGALGPFDLGSDGEGAEMIMVPAGGSRQRATGRPVEDRDRYFRMEGKKVFLRAITHMAKSAETVLDKAGLRLDDIDKFVYHQANARILYGVADRLGQPRGKFFSNIDMVGNTAAASVPIALATANESGELKVGHRVMLGAFGGGLTWGTTLVRWPEIEAL
ncbi:MAG TPA: beta-ketoacyl-ACP synthase III [Actinophytocola sp.]|uniref:beta-ketoacyl-ACP synthase III n=1 Tax=Actinophytocola sp. TaxID=1872138 RepID=UPI002DDCA71C|nr:beta-ketoacyl-ACP synthase III [Actinophytocola sp.]HEV2779908.1 beta-ketoacyl-ACP synthase III [Actinophytocola sp.]